MGATLVENITPSYLLLRSMPGSRIAADGFGETYLLYGAKLQHHVEHAVLRGPRGTFRPISSCGEWQQWLAHGSFGYVVLPERSGSPERWTNAIPGAERVLSAGNVVFKLPRLVPTQEYCTPASS
jgi:hypothetical protein